MMHLDDAAIVMCLCGEQTITIAIKATGSLSIMQKE